jgi:NADH-quinone oxidoreductase subunit L
MLIGTLAITGVGVIQIAGLPGFGFAGFYSKDAIIESTWQASGSNAGGFAFFVSVFAALLTSFYSWRLIFLTFFGNPRWVASEHIQHVLHDPHGLEHNPPDAEDAGHVTHPGDALKPIREGTGGYHPHESPWTMLIPLGVLAFGAAFAGMIWHAAFLDAEEGARFWAGSIAFNAHLMHALHQTPMLVKLLPAIVMLTGLAIAWFAYIGSRTLATTFVSHFQGLYAFLLNKWYFDELYDIVFIRPSLWIGRLFWKRGDEGTIDRFGPDGVAAVVAGGSRLTARLQSGYVYTYALVMLLGIAAAATWIMAR